MTAFEHVLVLIACFSLPQTNPKEVKRVHDFATSVVAGVITKETVWRSKFANKRMEGTEEGFGPQGGLDMNNVGPPAKEDLRLRVTSVKRGRVGGCFVSEEVIVKAKHIELRVGSVP